MPLRLWRAGPGVSVALTHTAPVEMVMPAAKSPHCAPTSAGSKMASVVRSPSEKCWLKKKYERSRRETRGREGNMASGKYGPCPVEFSE